MLDGDIGHNVLYIQVQLIYNKALNTVHFQVKINMHNLTDRHQCKLLKNIAFIIEGQIKKKIQVAIKQSVKNKIHNKKTFNELIIIQNSTTCIRKHLFSLHICTSVIRTFGHLIAIELPVILIV